jgi:glycosyltransferase involved in cell wall biosynthesis
MEANREPWPEYVYYAKQSRFAVSLRSISGDAIIPRDRFLLQRRFAESATEMLSRIDWESFDSVIAIGEDVGLPISLNIRKPTYIWMHGFLRNRSTMMQSAACNSLTQFIFLSSSLRERISREFEIPRSRTHVLINSVDAAFFSGAENTPLESLVVAAGAQDRDYPTLVHACSGLPLKLIIAAGSTWYPSPHGLDLSSLPPNVEVGPANYVQLRELYRRAQFIVVPLHAAHHACGYSVIAEAMAMGKAVIATRTELPGDHLSPGETGLYVRPGSVEDLRAAIEMLLSNPSLAVKMGRRGRERFLSLFTHDHFARGLDDIISSRRPQNQALISPCVPHRTSGLGEAAKERENWLQECNCQSRLFRAAPPTIVFCQ